MDLKQHIKELIKRILWEYVILVAGVVGVLLLVFLFQSFSGTAPTTAVFLGALIAFSLMLGLATLLFLLVYIPKLLYKIYTKNERIEVLRIFSVIPEFVKWWILIPAITTVLELVGITVPSSSFLIFVIALPIALWRGFTYRS